MTLKCVVTSVTLKLLLVAEMMAPVTEGEHVAADVMGRQAPRVALDAPVCGVRSANVAKYGAEAPAVFSVRVPVMLTAPPEYVSVTGMLSTVLPLSVMETVGDGVMATSAVSAVGCWTNWTDV